MSEKNLWEQFEFDCPKCGERMRYIGGIMNWECPSCGAEAYQEYNERTGEDYVILAEDYTLEDILVDPEGNKPTCCDACGGPYPDCLTACKIFDD